MVQPGRPPSSMGKLVALLGASIAVGSAAMLYFLLNNKDRAIMVPLYVHLANARGLLPTSWMRTSCGTCRRQSPAS